MYLAVANVNYDDDIRIGAAYIKEGMLELSKYNINNVNLYVPMLLLSAGFEKILKVCLYNTTYKQQNRFPKIQELQVIKHDLMPMLISFIKVYENSKEVHVAHSGPFNIHFLRYNEDFYKLFHYINNFNITSRYFNLHDETKITELERTPHILISLFTKELSFRHPELSHELSRGIFTNPEIYEKCAVYMIELLQRFMQIVRRSMRKGLFGPKGFHFSETHLADFYRKWYDPMHILKFADNHDKTEAII